MKQSTEPTHNRVEKPPNICIKNLIHSGVDFGGESSFQPSSFRRSSTWASAVKNSPSVFFRRRVVGTFGSVHPEVLSLFELEFPTSAVDIDLQAFLVAGVEGVGDAAAVAAAGIAALDVSDVLAMTAEELRNKDAKELAK